MGRTALEVRTVERLAARRVEPPAQQYLAPADGRPALPTLPARPLRRLLRGGLALAHEEHVVALREAPEPFALARRDGLERAAGLGVGAEARGEVGEDGELRGDVRAVRLGGLALVEVVHADGGERGAVQQVREVREAAHRASCALYCVFWGA